MNDKLAILINDATDMALEQQLAVLTGLPLVTVADILPPLVLMYEQQHLQLRNTLEKNQKPLWIDFTAGTLAYRRQTAGRQQDLARAIGVKAQHKPRILDATAGLGRDAFVLACLGCHVQMLERSRVMAALLQDALQRLYADRLQSEGLHLNLQISNAVDYLAMLTADNYPDVIYIDPMFPERQKTSLVKKEMRMVRDVLGDDTDAEQLLFAALPKALQRIVVKRHRLAPLLADQKPHFQIIGKSTRFDVYLPNNT